MPSNHITCSALFDIQQFQSVERICVPSNEGFQNGVRLGLALFQSVERICVPSNCKNFPRSHPRVFGVSIRRTDLCAFELHNHHNFAWKELVSIRRTDLCAFEPAGQPARAMSRGVSIRRTDLCAFEPRSLTPMSPTGDTFQSVERICVPSNPGWYYGLDC